MTKRELTQLSFKVTGYAIKIHKALGPGLLEKVYEKCLIHELIKNGHYVEQQPAVPVYYDDILINTTLNVDILIDELVIVELKAVKELLPVHDAQILTYMKLLKIPQGLLFNFYTDNITKSMKPFVNEYFSMFPD